MASEQMRPKVVRFRARWRAHQHRLDPRRLIFIDETWIKTNMTRTRGWGPHGKRLTAHIPHGHWKTLTFLAGLRHDRIVAPFVLDGPINGDAFTAWVSQCLVPELAPGDIVVADNLGSHKGKSARQLIRDAKAHLLFLPPYSPDLNPIEMLFAKLKTLFRKADERSIEASWKRVGTLLDTFTPTECQNYLQHAGYASIQIRHALRLIACLRPLFARRGAAEGGRRARSFVERSATSPPPAGLPRGRAAPWPPRRR